MAGPEASRRGTYSRVKESGRSKAATSMERKQKLANEKGEKCSVQERVWHECGRERSNFIDRTLDDLICLKDDCGEEG